jgi:hypothetical protein
MKNAVFWNVTFYNLEKKFTKISEEQNASVSYPDDADRVSSLTTLPDISRNILINASSTTLHEYPPVQWEPNLYIRTDTYDLIGAFHKSSIPFWKGGEFIDYY